MRVFLLGAFFFWLCNQAVFPSRSMVTKTLIQACAWSMN